MAAGAYISPLDFVYDPAFKVTHLAQSRYAADHLSGRNLDAVMVTDHLNSDSLSEFRRLRSAPKENIIAYNPAKGMEITRRLIRRAPHITWAPIQRMTRPEVVDLLGRCKAYIDFGNHPGRDRLPREAAAAGACVVVGRRGSAANDVDVPIPEKYKFSTSVEDEAGVIDLLDVVLTDHARHITDFLPYVRWVEGHEQNFSDEVFLALSAMEAQMSTSRRFHV